MVRLRRLKHTIHCLSSVSNDEHLFMCTNIYCMFTTSTPGLIAWGKLLLSQQTHTHSRGTWLRQQCATFPDLLQYQDSDLQPLKY